VRLSSLAYELTENAYSKCTHIASSFMDPQMRSCRSMFIYLSNIGTVTSIIISTGYTGFVLCLVCMYVCDDVIQFYCTYSYVIFCLYIEMNVCKKKLYLSIVECFQYMQKSLE